MISTSRTGTAPTIELYRGPRVSTEDRVSGGYAAPAGLRMELGSHSHVTACMFDKPKALSSRMSQVAGVAWFGGRSLSPLRSFTAIGHGALAGTGRASSSIRLCVGGMRTRVTQKKRYQGAEDAMGMAFAVSKSTWSLVRRPSPPPTTRSLCSIGVATSALSFGDVMGVLSAYHHWHHKTSESCSGSRAIGDRMIVSRTSPFHRTAYRSHTRVDPHMRWVLQVSCSLVTSIVLTLQSR